MNRTQKAELVAGLHKTFSEATVVVVTRQTGLTVAEVTDLRAKVREAGARFKVTKNRLARRALQGTQYEGLADQFVGPTAIATSADPVAAPKVVVDFARTNEKLAIVGGAIGVRLLDQAAVEALAKLPSLDQLRAKIIGLLQAPAGRMVGVLQAPAGQLARVMKARAESQQGAA